MHGYCVQEGLEIDSVSAASVVFARTEQTHIWSVFPSFLLVIQPINRKFELRIAYCRHYQSLNLSTVCRRTQSADQSSETKTTKLTFGCIPSPCSAALSINIS